MSSTSHTYIAIDLKSYYASLEAVERHLDPLTACLVVADISRTEKTICLAVSPSLRAYGIPGRARLFEVVQKVREINARRLSDAIRQHKAIRSSTGQWTFSGKSSDAAALAKDISLALDFIIAPPHMAHYMSCSARIYSIYLKYLAPEDIHVYSIDEVFMDVTCYLDTYRLSARELAGTIIKDVLSSTGITATAGIGTNLYLAKIAMDIVAKHVSPDKNGVRIAELDEYTYRRLLWTHEPLTDFWRVGKGYARKLHAHGLFTMGDIARCSIGGENDYYNETLLYRLFGINAELLIDHAWGWEPCTMAAVKAYKPENSSTGSGQVLHCPYTFEKARLIVREMTDLMVLDLVDKGLVTNQIVLTVGYDIENLTGGHLKNYHGPLTTDHYGRKVPRHAHGTASLESFTSSTKQITDCMMALYDRIVDQNLLVRRVWVAAGHVVRETDIREAPSYEQLNLFTDYGTAETEEDTEKKAEGKKAEEKAEEKKAEEKKAGKDAEKKALEREKRIQKAMLDIRKKFGKNAILKGMNLEEGAMTIERNNQIGGHKA